VGFFLHKLPRLRPLLLRSHRRFRGERQDIWIPLVIQSLPVALDLEAPLSTFPCPYAKHWPIPSCFSSSFFCLSTWCWSSPMSLRASSANPATNMSLLHIFSISHLKTMESRFGFGALRPLLFFPGDQVYWFDSFSCIVQYSLFFASLYKTRLFSGKGWRSVGLLVVASLIPFSVIPLYFFLLLIT